MAYIIEYEPWLNKKYTKTKKHKCRIKHWKIITVILAVLVAMFPARQDINDFLIPGNVDVTTQAFTQMLDQIGAGEPIGECVTIFCMEILDHAKNDG